MSNVATIILASHLTGRFYAMITQEGVIAPGKNGGRSALKVERRGTYQCS